MVEGTLDLSVAKQYVVTEAILVIEVSGGPGIRNPAISEDAAKNSPAQNKWTLADSDFANPLKQFDPATDIRIEFRIKFNEAPSQQTPNPPTQSATVGSKIQKPTVP